MNDQTALNKFNSSIKTLGYVFVTIALLCNFVPAVYASITTRVFPAIGDLLTLWVAAASAFGVGYFVQPISFFPMANMAGSFMCWIAGNVGEIRIPAAQRAPAHPKGPNADISTSGRNCSSPCQKEREQASHAFSSRFVLLFVLGDNHGTPRDYSSRRGDKLPLRQNETELD